MESITHSSCSLIILVNSPSGREVIPFEDKYLKKNQVIKLSEKVYNGHIPCEFSLCDTGVIRSKISSSSDFMTHEELPVRSRLFSFVSEGTEANATT